MREYLKFYIDGQWVQPNSPSQLEVINPATEKVAGVISMGNEADVDLAVKAARNAFHTYSLASVEARLELLNSIAKCYKQRWNDIADAITEEMGAPKSISVSGQTGSGYGLFKTAMANLQEYQFSHQQDSMTIIKEPIGVCGFITPWNWPINQIACKLAPALATGCTVVLKPSEIAPFSAQIMMEVLDEAGVPKGVVNMVQGDGPTVGSAISKHADIDMVSFTGSTRAGILVAQDAATTIKRVTQELGGKSANIILDDLDHADFHRAVSGGVKSLVSNTGQSCNAPSRMFIPECRLHEAEKIASLTMQAVPLGDPQQEGAFIGPVVSQVQYNRIQNLIQAGINSEATLLAGGVGKPEGFETGYYVKPTLFSNVTNDMRIAQEEIFGPVLCMISYKNDEEAIAMANDNPYGLSAYVSGADSERTLNVAKRLRAGNIHVNGGNMTSNSPFGGYKQSGNGRERGEFGFEEFLEIKAVLTR